MKKKCLQTFWIYKVSWTDYAQNAVWSSSKQSGQATNTLMIQSQCKGGKTHYVNLGANNNRIYL